MDFIEGTLLKDGKSVGRAFKENGPITFGTKFAHDSKWKLDSKSKPGQYIMKI